MRILPMSAVLCGCSVSPIDIRYQLSGVRYCSDPQYLDYCLFSGLSVIMRIQYAFCSLCNLGVYCKLLSSAMTYVRTAAAVVLLLMLGLDLHSSSCSNRPQQQRCLLLLLLLLRLLPFCMLCCCYRFHVRKRPSLLHKRRWK